MCYTVGPCGLSVLPTVVCICYSQTPNLSNPPYFPFGNYKFVLYVCWVNFCFVNKFIYISFLDMRFLLH